MLIIFIFIIMQRFENTDKPLSSLTGIRQSIHYDDNSPMVKLQSKKKLEGLNDMLLTRQYSIQQARFIKEDINNNIIEKLQRILSNKFSLTRDDYLILIDKYNLRNTVLSRKNILEMVDYLNMRNRFSGENNNDRIIYKKPPTIFENKQNNIPSRIIIPEYEPPNKYLDKPVEPEEDFETRLQALINSRENNNSSKIDVTNRPQTSMPVNSNIPTLSNGKQYNDKQMVIPDHLQFPSNPKVSFQSNDSNEKKNYQANPMLPLKSQDPVKNINESKIHEPSQTILYKNQYPNRDNHTMNNGNQTVNNSTISKSDIETSLQKIVDNLQQLPVPKPIIKKKELNIMANIINSDKQTTQMLDKFIFDVNYADKTSIECIDSIELVSCFVNENFYKKNDFKQSPYFLMKILEFNDILYLNGSSIGGFCQILWEKKGTYYHYINNDKIFGIYNSTKDMVLDKLTIELYDHKGQCLKDIKYTENDQFNIVFKIITNID